MADDIGSALTTAIAGAWITTGDPDVLMRALAWPDIPLEVIRASADIAETVDDDRTKIRLIEAIALALKGRERETPKLQYHLDRLSRKLYELAEEGYTSSDTRILQAAEALKAARDAGTAPHPDSPLIATEPEHRGFDRGR